MGGFTGQSPLSIFSCVHHSLLLHASQEDRMKKSIASLSDSFNTIRTGRASAAILDKIVVEVAGAPMALKAVAQVRDRVKEVAGAPMALKAVAQVRDRGGG